MKQLISINTGLDADIALNWGPGALTTMRNRHNFSYQHNNQQGNTRLKIYFNSD